MPCRLREAWHFTLPEAVTLKRFLAPLLVFNLGIWLPFLGPRRGSPNGSGRGELSDSGKHASRHGMPRRAAPLDGPYRVDLSRIARPARRRRLTRSEHHHHLPAFEPRFRFNLGDGRGVLLDPVEQLRAELLMRHLTASEAQGHFDLVALLEEAADRAHLHVVVVRVDVRPHLDL